MFEWPPLKQYVTMSNVTNKLIKATMRTGLVERVKEPSVMRIGSLSRTS